MYEGGDLRFVGHVGTGFSDLDLDDLHKQLLALERADSPYAGEVPREHARFAQWVDPSLTGEVAFSRWTRDGMLLHASWRGLRPEIPRLRSTANRDRPRDAVIRSRDAVIRSVPSSTAAWQD